MQLEQLHGRGGIDLGRVSARRLRQVEKSAKPVNLASQEAEKLEALGAQVDYNDPHIPVIQPTREHANLVGRKSSEITDDFDLILLATHHREYSAIDFSGFQCPIVDTRNCVATRPQNYFRA